MSVSGEQLTQKGERLTVKRTDSPEPSYVSIKSDWSMEVPLHFKEGICPTDLRKMSDSPEPSGVSMKSDATNNFWGGECRSDASEHKENLVFTYRKHVESIFKELEQKVMFLMRKELKRFKKILIPDYPSCSGGEMEDEEDQSSVREGALKITLHVLRNMNQTDLANTLQTKVVFVYQQKLKHKLLVKCKRMNEGISDHGNSTLLNEIYTELYITEGGSGEVNNEHEVRQIETASRRPATQETPIKCNDLFKDKHIRSVLTKGVAGIGKTVSAQKFILDWAEGRANQDVLFIFPLPFRELNLMKEKKFSLMDLLHHFFPDTQQLKLIDCDSFKVIFIFDGLDECRLPLDFQNNESLWDVTESTSVDVLLTNLIKGNLLPSALLWITSRPAAANQIPPECVDKVTEVRGFSGTQKEEYFRKRISDQILANRIISHIKSSRSLYIMCHIPVFCWIAATVLEKMLGEAESGEIPKTLTQMFTHFLIFHIKHKDRKYQDKTDNDPYQSRKIILALGKLAFQQLKKGNLIFYEEDLRECGIDVKEVSVYSGVCTQIFREEFGLHLGKVFSFVHLSLQEFLAALYAFFSFISNNINVMEQQTTAVIQDIKISTMSDFLKNTVDKALQSENGHLDLFLRFLLGLSLESNQTLLQGLLTQTGSSSHSKEETVKYIKEKISENPSPDKSINLFHCLNELNDHSLVQEVQTYLSRQDFRSHAYGCLRGARLSPAQWSALVFVLLNSEEELEEFDLSKYSPSEECLLRLLPVVTASRKSLIECCGIREEGCATLCSALRSNPSSHLRELNLNQNDPGDSGVKQLSALLEDQHCKLEKLELSNCSIREEGCAALSSALRSNPSSHLRELNLNHNKPGDSGVKQLSALLESPHCKLKKLELCKCGITEEGCAVLCSALRSNPSSHLKELNLIHNKPGDTGVKQLSALLEDPHCKLEKLQSLIEKMAAPARMCIHSTSPAEEPSVHTITANDKSSVTAATFSTSTFNAPVNLNFYSDTDHTEQKSVFDHEYVKSVLVKHKTRLRKKFKFIYEGDSKIEHKTLFNEIYTGLFITERQSRREKECKHEMQQMERTSSTQSKHYTPIHCNDIFTENSKLKLNTVLKEEVEGEGEEEQDIRTVLTKGIAGIGKTVSVQKFIVDWAEGKANQHIDLVLVMPFRELNVVDAEKFSLCDLICIFNPELKVLHTDMYEEFKIVFILDGLDEFYTPMNFHQKLVSEITELSTVDTLVTNLIKGLLLPSSHIWITSRPAAADQIPSRYINRLTEIQGFSDLQKEEYFRKKIADEDQANKIISHIKTAQSLYMMCHIPVFCWITATLLQQILNEDSSEIPKTLTEMYTHFLFIQTRIKNQKYDTKEVNDPKHLMRLNKDMILKLAELAFKQLIKGKVIFSEKDLKECGIDVTEASVYSGICTEIFKEESVLYQRKVYCFVHLSFQEFLAAVHVLNCYLNQNMEALQFFMRDESNGVGSSEGAPLATISLHELLKRAVNKALHSENGHLDLFLRFLLGISLETNQKYLHGLLTVENNTSKSVKMTIRYIQNQITGDEDFERRRAPNMNPDSSINLYLCLTEMNDQSLRIQKYVESNKVLSPAHCSAVAYMLQMSENVLDVLDLKMYNTSVEGYRRLVPALSNCRKALLGGCLTEQSCGTVASLLQLQNSPLKELDISRNHLQDSGVKLLSDGLSSSYCKLELLRLLGCNLTEKSCENMATALLSASTTLKELDLSYNDLKDSGISLLSAGLRNSHCKLEILRLAVCNLTEKSGEILSLCLQSPSSSLKELELCNNDLHDSGIQLLSCGLKNSHCNLEILRLSGCSLTEDGCSSLISALSSNHSSLRVLDLSYNYPGALGELLAAQVDDPHSKLESIRMDHCGEFWIQPGLKKYACNLTLDPNTAHTCLALSDGNRKATCLREHQLHPDHPDRFDCRFQVLSKEGISGRSYWEIEWSGDSDIAATYKGIDKKGRSRKCRFGYNTESWRISCYNNSYLACHDDKSIEIPAPSSHSNRVGVFLNWPAGLLSFYNISADTHTLTHLYTFQSTFTEPLYVGFGFTYDSILHLCEME
ncbi:uncharacterized protein LOC143482365 [Brachyhypopomus gauderio]|uniref:uncharacterized protein LOC143482365 n=1 Tax=Brachyhypopomus gauderio TaxID=698409 RepID=UPI004043526A